MRIEISLNSKSIKEAIKKLDKIKKQYPKMIEELVENSFEWITERANDYLDRRTDGFDTSDIRESWRKVKISDGYYKIINISDEAVYAEFGTGIIGEAKPHIKANELGYEYDVNAHGEDGWTFYNKKQNLYLEGFVGYQGHSYLYDAFWDYFYEEKKYVDIWNNIYNKYFK